MRVPLRAKRDQVLAFRLAGHHLDTRLPRRLLLQAAGACGVQNTPPGSAALALHARVADLSPAHVEQALGTDKTLLQARSRRGAPVVFPTADLAVFTQALLPADEPSLRFFIRGAEPALERAGITAAELVARTSAALCEVLDGRALALEPLGVEVAQRLVSRLTPQQARAWQSPSWYAPGQTLGEALVHFALYVVALQGVYCLAPRRGAETPFVRTDQWLGMPPADVDAAAAGAELLRRYLRCFGPSTVEDFAAWAGIAPRHAERLWQRVEAELLPVQVGPRLGWLHHADSARFQVPTTTAVGVRLLPPHDPYLEQRDRQTLLADSTLHRQVWRAAGSPGAVLVDGQLVATWRAHKRGKSLQALIEPFAPLPSAARTEVEAEFQSIAAYRGCQTTELAFAC